MTLMILHEVQLDGECKSCSHITKLYMGAYINHDKFKTGVLINADCNNKECNMHELNVNKINIESFKQAGYTNDNFA